MGQESTSVEPASRDEWREWLADHADDGHGVWLVLHKGDEPPLAHEDAVEEAVSFGWVDSKPNRLDDRRYKLWLAPRKPGSGWSSLNKERVQRVLDSGLMTARGLAVVEAAKSDGSWDALNEVLSLQVPRDLQVALEASPAALSSFNAFPPSSKRIILEWISQTKKPDTRAARIRETVELAEQNIRAHHWRQPKGR